MARAKPWRRLEGNRGRDVALAALAEARRQHCFVRDACERLVRARGAVPAEAGLAMELAWGVVRHRLTLDRLIERFFTGQTLRLEATIHDVLRLGVYQLVYLDRIPAFAAVNEAVEQGKRIGGRRAGGLVNAVLRALLRQRAEQHVDWPGHHDPQLVRIDVASACAFGEPVLPEPATDRLAYLAAATSHPEPLIRRWIERFGLAQAEEALWCGTFRPALVLRANCLRTSPAALVAALATEGVEAVAAGDAVYVTGSAPPVERLAAFEAGLCQPQDPTAMAVLRREVVERCERMLDLCAAPGTKATQAAEMRGDRGTIVASDRNTKRLARVDANCRRLGIRSVQAVAAASLDEVVARDGPFDLILVDAPCSNTGVLSRRPEARDRLSGASLAALAASQQMLLTRAASLAGPHARIIYSTCSLEPEENEELVAAFARTHADWHVERTDRTLPHAGPAATDWHDGGFVAELQRA